MSNRLFRHRLLVALWVLPSCMASLQCPAQELEPHAYSPTPSNLNLFGVVYGRSEGELLFDASVPLKDAAAKVDSVALVYGKTFDILNRSGSVAVVLPYASGDIAGNVLANVGTVNAGYQEIHRAGFADAHLRLGLNLLGGPEFTPTGIARRSSSTAVGASLHIMAPTGKYDSSKAVNIGNNRWSFKGEIGASQPIGRWILDASAGMWFFTANDNFFNGSRREQDRMSSLQGHVSYAFAPQLWLAVGMNYYSGGRSRVDGQYLDDRKSNTRVGVSLALPAGKGQSIKLAWSGGARVRVGGDFHTYGIAWQYAWPD